MKVAVDRRVLLDGVSAVAHAISARSSLPIMQHICVRVQNETLHLLGSDLEQRIQYVLPAQVMEAGDFTLPARMASEVLSALPDGQLELHDDATRSIHVKCGRSEYRLLGLNADEYPDMGEVTEEKQFVVPATVLSDMVRQTAFAVSTDEGRAILTGILMEFDGVTLRLVATDTHRMALRSQLVGTVAYDELVQVVVPARALSELMRIIGNDDRDIRVTIGNTMVSFCPLDDPHALMVTTRLVDGAFPDYNRIIPRNCIRKFTVQTQDMLAAVKRVNLVSRDTAGRVIVSTHGDDLVLEAESAALGRAHEVVDAIRVGDDITLGFNGKYMADVLNVLDSEGAVMEMTEAMRPIVVRPADSDTYLYLLMPMAVS